MLRRVCCFVVTALLVSLSAVAAPQAIVFDFGGVLTGKPNREAVVHFIRDTFQLSKTEFEQVSQDHKAAMKAGLTDEDFWVGYAQQLGVELSTDWLDQFYVAVMRAVNVNEQMYILVDELKEKPLVVAMLSNIDDRLARLIRSCGLYEPFEPCILSCEIGVDKPDPEAYRILLDRLALPADAVVFIDDKQDNVDSARELGIDAIVFTSEDQLREELRLREVL